MLPLRLSHELYARDATADVDAVFEPPQETRQWAERVAEDKGWPSDWLNDGAKGYLNQKSAGPVPLRKRNVFAPASYLEQR